MQRVRNVHHPSPATAAVIRGLPPPSCSVIGESEFQRIQDIAAQRAMREAEAEAERRRSLHATSKERVGHWPNTIEAQRLRKEKLRAERMEREEERRRLIDQEEEALRKEQKDRAVRRANAMLYEENERVKAFTSNLLQTTVFAEREEQMKVRSERAQIQRADDMAWHAVEMEKLKAAEEEERRKAQQEREQSVLIKSEQQRQLQDQIKLRIAERERAREEGRKLRRDAEEAQFAEKEEVKRRRGINRSIHRELLEAYETQKHAHEIAKERELAEDELIAKYAQEKEAQEAQRKREAEEKHETKMRQRQGLIERQAKALQELQASVEEREMKAMRDFEAERAAREERERHQRQQRQEEMETFRQAQRAQKKAEEARRQSDEDRMKRVWQQRSEILVDEELAERREKREAAERLQRILLLQKQEKDMQVLAEKRQEIEEGIAIQEGLKQEEDMYTSYVGAVMGEYLKNGRNCAAVQQAARRAMKPRMPQ